MIKNGSERVGEHMEAFGASGSGYRADGVCAKSPIALEQEYSDGTVVDESVRCASAGVCSAHRSGDIVCPILKILGFLQSFRESFADRAGEISPAAVARRREHSEALAFSQGDELASDGYGERLPGGNPYLDWGSV